MNRLYLYFFLVQIYTYNVRNKKGSFLPFDLKNHTEVNRNENSNKKKCVYIE